MTRTACVMPVMPSLSVNRDKRILARQGTQGSSFLENLEIPWTNFALFIYCPTRRQNTPTSRFLTSTGIRKYTIGSDAPGPPHEPQHLQLRDLTACHLITIAICRHPPVKSAQTTAPLQDDIHTSGSLANLQENAQTLKMHIRPADGLGS